MVQPEGDSMLLAMPRPGSYADPVSYLNTFSSTGINQEMISSLSTALQQNIVDVTFRKSSRWWPCLKIFAFHLKIEIVDFLRLVIQARFVAMY